MSTRQQLEKLGMARKLRGAKLQAWVDHNLHEDEEPMPLTQAADEPKQKPVMRPKRKPKAKAEA